MSEVEYNNLLYQIRKRLDELNVGEQLLFLCRGKVTARNEENNIQTRLLIEELEEKGFLSPDRLVLLKGILKGIKEWALFQQVEKFETKRKEYNDLLERIIRVFEELNDLEGLVSICREKLTEEMQGNVHDVRSLFKELERNDFLGIDYLDCLKEILTKSSKNDLFKEVEEFEQRQSREIKFEMRKARAAGIVSSVSDKLAGVLNIKTVFKMVAGGFTMASSLELLIRDSSYDQLISAVTTCVLPAGANLIQITEGCVCLKVQVDSVSTLDVLWQLYRDGTLKARLQALFVTDEMRGLAGGEVVEVIVTIDEHEYEKTRNKLASEAQEDPDGKEEQQLRYLDPEKYDYIQNYLVESEAHSVTTESDSGKPGSIGAPSEVGTEETADSLSKLCLKDLSEELCLELTSSLQTDPVALERFYKSFGLDPVKLRTTGLWNIREFFPDTSVRLLKEVFEALQLYDLVELLEKVTKPRALRTALPLKEIEKLPIASSRPTKIYSKAEVLIISYDENGVAEDEAVKLGSFFQDLNPQSQVTSLTAKASAELFEDLQRLRASKARKEQEAMMAENREKMLKELLKQKIPDSWYDERERGYWSNQEAVPETNEQLLSMFLKEKPEMQRELRELVGKREQWTKERIPIIEEVKQKEEELKRENEKFKMAVVTHISNWKEQTDDGLEGLKMD